MPVLSLDPYCWLNDLVKDVPLCDRHPVLERVKQWHADQKRLIASAEEGPSTSGHLRQPLQLNGRKRANETPQPDGELPSAGTTGTRPKRQRQTLSHSEERPTEPAAAEQGRNGARATKLRGRPVAPTPITEQSKPARKQKQLVSIAPGLNSQSPSKTKPSRARGSLSTLKESEKLCSDVAEMSSAFDCDPQLRNVLSRDPEEFLTSALTAHGEDVRLQDFARTNEKGTVVTVLAAVSTWISFSANSSDKTSASKASSRASWAERYTNSKHALNCLDYGRKYSKLYSKCGGMILLLCTRPTYIKDTKLDQIDRLGEVLSRYPRKEGKRFTTWWTELFAEYQRVRCPTLLQKGRDILSLLAFGGRMHNTVLTRGTQQQYRWTKEGNRKHISPAESGVRFSLQDCGPDLQRILAMLKDEGHVSLEDGVWSYIPKADDGTQAAISGRSRYWQRQWFSIIVHGSPLESTVDQGSAAVAKLYVQPLKMLWQEQWIFDNEKYFNAILGVYKQIQEAKWDIEELCSSILKTVAHALNPETYAYLELWYARLRVREGHIDEALEVIHRHAAGKGVRLRAGLHRLYARVAEHKAEKGTTVDADALLAEFPITLIDQSTALGKASTDRRKLVQARIAFWIAQVQRALAELSQIQSPKVKGLVLYQRLLFDIDPDLRVLDQRNFSPLDFEELRLIHNAETAYGSEAFDNAVTYYGQATKVKRDVHQIIAHFGLAKSITRQRGESDPSAGAAWSTVVRELDKLGWRDTEYELARLSQGCCDHDQNMIISATARLGKIQPYYWITKSSEWHDYVTWVLQPRNLASCVVSFADLELVQQDE